METEIFGSVAVLVERAKIAALVNVELAVALVELSRLVETLETLEKELES